MSDLYVSDVWVCEWFVCECFVWIVCVCEWMWEEAAAGREEEEDGADDELETRTPHNDVGKKRQFRGNKNYLSFGVSETECSQNPANMQWNAIFIAYVVQTGLFFLLLIFGNPYGGKITGTRELSMPLFTWNMHFTWQHCGLLQKDLNLECPMPRWWQAF